MCEEPSNLDLEMAAATGDFWEMLAASIEEAGGDGATTCDVLRGRSFEEGVHLLATNGIRPFFDEEKNKNTKRPLYDDDPA